MTGLASTCGASAAIGVVHLSLVGAVVAAMGLLVLGILASEGMHRWLEQGDEQIAAALRAAEDESLEIAERVIAPYPGPAPQIPAQRVTNGEDLLKKDGER